MHDWPFNSPKNEAVITSTEVVRGEDYVATVTHDEADGGWQFIGSRGLDYSNAYVVALSEAISTDASLRELFDLPLGWMAFRKTAQSAWQRKPGRP